MCGVCESIFRRASLYSLLWVQTRKHQPHVSVAPYNTKKCRIFLILQFKKVSKTLQSWRTLHKSCIIIVVDENISYKKYIKKSNTEEPRRGNVGSTYLDNWDYPDLYSPYLLRLHTYECMYDIIRQCGL